MGPTRRDRAWFAAAIVAGAVLLVAGIWYVRALSPIVETELVVAVTVAFLAVGVVGSRAYLGRHPKLDSARQSSGILEGMIDELAHRTGVPRPRVGLDDSRLGRAVANVGAIELGPGTETILVTEQLVADLEGRRFDPASLRGVILHELGHLALNHSYLRLWTSIGERLIRLAAAVAVVALLLEGRARRELVANPELGVLIALGPFAVATILGVIQRAQEAQADAFAVRHAAGRELIAFLHWMSTDLAPILRLDRSGVPRDPEQRRELRMGIQRLIAEAEAVNDEERADFMRQALARLHEYDREAEPDLPAVTRWLLVTRRIARKLALAWVGVVPWNRSHPPVDVRLARIAAELGMTAAGGAAAGNVASSGAEQIDTFARHTSDAGR